MFTIFDTHYFDVTLLLKTCKICAFRIYSSRCWRDDVIIVPEQKNLNISDNFNKFQRL